MVEDDLDRDDEAIKFAMDTLERTSTNVAGVNQLDAIAERARIELPL